MPLSFTAQRSHEDQGEKNNLSPSSPGWSRPHNRRGSSVDNFRFLFLFPLSLDKGVTVILSGLFSLQAVKSQAGSAGTPCQTSALAATATPLSNNDALFLKLKEENAQNGKPLGSVTPLNKCFSSALSQNETEDQLVFYFVWGKRKSFHRPSSAPWKDDK